MFLAGPLRMIILMILFIVTVRALLTTVGVQPNLLDPLDPLPRVGQAAWLRAFADLSNSSKRTDYRWRSSSAEEHR